MTFRHPENHISFLENCTDPDRELSTEDKERILNQFDNVTFVRPVKLKQVFGIYLLLLLPSIYLYLLNIKFQTLYPKHCIANTWGAEVLSGLQINLLFTTTLLCM